MKQRIAALLIALAGILLLIIGMVEGKFSTIFIGIGFCIISSLFFIKRT